MTFFLLSFKVFFLNKFLISFYSYLWSGLIVVFGIYLNVYSKKNKLSLKDVYVKCFKFLHLAGARHGTDSRKLLLDV